MVADMFRMIALIFALTATAAAAERPLTAEEFQARVSGKTLEFAVGGVPFGVEQYLRNRQVRWSYLNDTCDEGYWYPEGEQICFVYETIPSPQCWTFYLEGDALTARFEGDDDLSVYQTKESNRPMQCLGPKVGV